MFEFLSKIIGLARPYRIRLAFGILFGVLAGLAEPLMIVTIAVVYTLVFQDASILSDPEQTWARKLPDFARDWLVERSKNGGATTLLVATIPLVFMIRGLVTYLNVYLLSWVSIRAVTDLRIRLFTHLIGMPASFFSGSRSAELMSRVLADTEMLRATIANSISTLVKDPVTLIAMLGYLFWSYPKLTGLSMLVLPLCIVPIAVFGRKGRKATASMQQHVADLSNAIVEGFSGIRIVKAYNLENAVVRQFRETANKFISNYMKVVRSTETPGPLLEFAGSIGVALLLLYAVHQSQRPDARAFLTLVLAIITMYRPMKALVRLHAVLEQSRAASERVFDLLATGSSLAEPTSPKQLKAAGADIRFENVSFAYGEKTVLKNFTLTVKSGTLVALVGASGSGKTTVTNLILRFYDPVEGNILIGGTDIRDVATRDLRDQIAIVTQETILFNDTIGVNIALGKTGATRDQLIAAAKHAHAHDFITDKPEGYDTLIGERGITLSGGQRQRLAIARAILKDAPILVLDEATSALDTESERAVQAALEELMAGRTTICIAHRLSTIQKADMIVVMKDGQIAETGTHTELLARKGVYHNLHQLNA